MVDLTYQTKNYEQDGGTKWVVGGTLEIANGGTLVLDAGATLQQSGNAGQAVGGRYTVTAGDVTATHALIVTGLTTLNSDVAMILRAGKVATSDAGISVSAGTITVAAGSTYVLTAGDVINWMAVGA